jgi:hypothetical protein
MPKPSQKYSLQNDGQSRVRGNDGPITLLTTRSNNRTTEQLPGLIAVVPLTVPILDPRLSGRYETKFRTFSA